MPTLNGVAADGKVVAFQFSDSLADLIRSISRRYGVPPSITAGIVGPESGFVVDN